MTLAMREIGWPDVPELLALDSMLFPSDAWPSASWWAELAARPRRDYVLLHADGRVIGYAGLDHTGSVSDIMTVAVAPEAQGRGVGRMLLQELETRSIARGATAMMLEVRADNAAAIGLYERAGFELIRRRRRYYQPGDIDALVMRKHLPTSTQRAQP
ncbi:MAG: ribosomal protein S18-alanine N-acetyltransferase [Nostocoides sp.]|uniref:ribosomal protein S18-alanine N-acetyltransferase n=1 Tax=Nostocoides sp. TaxID=1917966 RepID=UPI002C1E3D82|nr:ribosomal protein S18-alanine N-acetyltransferase [Tetrasphaera sp.]